MTDTDPSAGFNTFTCWLSVKISLPPKEGTQLGCRASITCEMVRPSRFTLYKPCSTCAGSTVFSILGDPGAASRDDGIFVGESLQQERESPWALTLTERVPEAFEIPPSDIFLANQKFLLLFRASGGRSGRFSAERLMRHVTY